MPLVADYLGGVEVRSITFAPGPGASSSGSGAKVIDLTELLTRSLKGAKAGAAAKKGARAAPKAGKAAAKKTTRAKAAPARKSEERRAA